MAVLQDYYFSKLFHKRGIDSIALERKTKEYVLDRIRAGVLERGFVSLMLEAGVAEPLDAGGFMHQDTQVSFGDTMFLIGFKELTSRPVTVYGQTEVTRDLYAACEAANCRIEFNVENVVINDAKSDAPYLYYSVAGENCRIECNYITGCDGFHGVSRSKFPADVRCEHEKTYPFGWLGILSETPPVEH